MDLASIITWKTKFRPLNRPIGPSPKASIDEEPKIELKSLPSHLKYAFLGENDICLVILFTGLSDVREKEALTVLERMKKVIGWKISNITGMNPIFYMHKIYMEDGYKASVQHLRRMNYVMKKVVKKKSLSGLMLG